MPQGFDELLNPIGIPGEPSSVHRAGAAGLLCFRAKFSDFVTIPEFAFGVVAGSNPSAESPSLELEFERHSRPVSFPPDDEILKLANSLSQSPIPRSNSITSMPFNVSRLFEGLRPRMILRPTFERMFLRSDI